MIFTSNHVSPSNIPFKRTYVIKVVTQDGREIKIIQPFDNSWDATETAIEAAGDGGHVVFAQPLIPITYLEGRLAYVNLGELHENATEDAKLGYESAQWHSSGAYSIPPLLF